MPNEVRIVVTAQKSTGDIPKAKAEVKDLRGEIDKIPSEKTVRIKVKDDGVARASDQVRAALARQESAVGQLRVAQLRFGEIQEKGTASAAQYAAAEEAVARAQRSSEAAARGVAAAQERLGNVRAQAAEREAQAAQSVNAPTPMNFDIRGAARRFGGQAMGEFKSAGIQAGAMFAGGLAAGISTVGAAGMFIGIAAAAQSQVPAVAEVYGQLWNHIKAGAKDASSELSDDFINGAERLGATFNKIEPQLREAFHNAQEPLNDLYTGVDKFATSAMPGLVTATGAAKDVTDDLAVAMDRAGRGVSNFFTEASQGAPAAGDAFAEFGKIVERLGTFSGRILAELANNGRLVFPMLTTAVDSTATAVESLAHNALPALASGASMGLSAFTLLVNLANTLINALGPIAPAVSTVLTSFKLLDMVTFGGVGRAWDSFKQSIADAPTLAGKTQAGFKGLLTTLGPVAIGAGLLGFALDALGSSQQKTAQRQASLTQAFRESKGAIDDNVRATVAKNLQDDQLLSKGTAIGISAKTMVDAWLGNKDAIDNVRSATQFYLKDLEGQGQLEGQVAEGSDTMAAKAHDVANALGDQGSEAHKAAEDGKLYADALDQGAGATDKLAASIQKLHEQLVSMVDKELGYRIAVDATKDAQSALSEAEKAVGEARQKHGEKSKEYIDAQNAYGDASRGVESALVAQANAARELAMAQSTAATDAQKNADGQAAYAAEVIKMAAAAGSAAPPALRQMVAGLSETELAANGATRSIEGTGTMVYNLPGGKTIKIEANDQASWKIIGVQEQLAGIQDKWVRIDIHQVTTFDTIYKESAPGSQPFSQGRKAAGGPVGAASGGARSSITRVNEMGPELGREQNGVLRDLQTGMQVIPAGQSAQIMAGSNTGGYGGGGGAGWSGGPITVNLVLDKRVLQSVVVPVTQDYVSGRGGNVQSALGR